MTIVVDADIDTVKRAEERLGRIEEVIKLRLKPKSIPQILQMAELVGAQVISVSDLSMVLTLAAEEKKVSGMSRLSDGAINILSNFNRKVQILHNAVEAARKLGIRRVRVAMPATLDAFLMKKFSGTGFFGECAVDGPFAARQREEEAALHTVRPPPDGLRQADAVKNSL